MTADSQSVITAFRRAFQNPTKETVLALNNAWIDYSEHAAKDILDKTDKLIEKVFEK